MRIKIVFHGHPCVAIPFDADTGEQLLDVKRVDLVTVDVNNGVFEARLVYDVVVIEGEMIASATVPPQLSDADIDSIAHRVEKRLARNLRMLGVNR